MKTCLNFIYPEIVLEAFPILKNMEYVRQFVSPMPLSPDTIFYLFNDKIRSFYTLVMTDYADPINQSKELRQISDGYAFEFTKLVKPYANNTYIKIKENDDMTENPTIPSVDSHCYFYVAKLKHQVNL